MQIEMVKSAMDLSLILFPVSVIVYIFVICLQEVNQSLQIQQNFLTIAEYFNFFFP